MALSKGFDPAQDIQLDATTLRALAHPLRVRLLGRLRMYGPATATQLARGLGESSGATSYHLRELAKHGLVAEVEERSKGRERWWRAMHRSTHYNLTLDPESKATGGEYLRAVARVYSDRLLHYSDNIEYSADIHGDDWAEAFTLSDSHLRLGVDQARRLREELEEVLDRYRDLPPDPDGKRIVAQIQVFPIPEPEVEPEPEA
jgi:DNA-binding transcriptional ArsR family regulator